MILNKRICSEFHRKMVTEFYSIASGLEGSSISRFDHVLRRSEANYGDDSD